MLIKRFKCDFCQKEIPDVEYIRYWGLCCICWNKPSNKKK